MLLFLLLDRGVWVWVAVFGGGWECCPEQDDARDAKRVLGFARMGTLMKIWRSAGHSGWLGVVVGEFSAYGYVAIVAICAGAAAANGMAGWAANNSVRGKLLIAVCAIGVVNYCFPKYKWLFPFGALVYFATCLAIGLLDPRNDYAAKVGIGFVVSVELLLIFARWRAGGGIV
jgi:hypothetical protein